MSQDLEQFNWEKPLKVNGGISATNTFYASEGMQARREPWFWSLNGNLNFNLFGIINVPVSVQITQQNRSYTQPFNQVGFSPQYKALTIHAGYRSLQFSNYTLGGSQWLGGGIEYHPENSPFFASALYGRFQKKVTEEVNDELVTGTPAYERWGYSSKVGYQRNGRSFALILFRGKDDALTVPDSVAEKTGIHPGENFVWAITTKQNISRSINFDIEYAMSAYTIDSRQTKSNISTYRYANHLGSILETNNSTEVNRAILTNIYYNRSVYQLKFTYRRIDPDYKTMGSVFLNNDLEDISAGINWRMFRQKINTSVTGGVQRNNLDNKLIQEAVRNAFSTSVTYNVNQKLNINAQYSNFLSNTKFNNINITANQLALQSNSDSLRYNQVTQNSGVNINYQFGDSVLHHGIFINGNWQQARDSKENDSDFYSGMAGYAINFIPAQVSINAGMLSTFNTVAGIQNQMLGPSIGVNKIIRKKIRIGLNSTYTTTYMDNVNSGYNWSNRINIGIKSEKHHSLTTDFNWLFRKANSGTSQEWRGSIVYGYTF